MAVGVDQLQIGYIIDISLWICINRRIVFYDGARQNTRSILYES